MGSLSEAGLQKLRPVSRCSGLVKITTACYLDRYSADYWFEKTSFDIQSASLLSVFSCTVILQAINPQILPSTIDYASPTELVSHTQRLFYGFILFSDILFQFSSLTVLFRCRV